MTCSICFHDFNEHDKIPIMINCGHSFCNTCLSHLENLDVSVMLCPLCKSNIKDGFKCKNYALIEVLRNKNCLTIKNLEKCIQSLNDEISEKANMCMSLHNKYISLQADYLELTSDYNNVFKEEYEKALQKAKDKFNEIEKEWVIEIDKKKW